MKNPDTGIERRRFLKMLAAGGMMPLLASAANGASALLSSTPSPAGQGKVPRRILGKTGVSVPCMAVGCTSNMPASMERALHWGFNHFDTAASYAGAEAGIGKFLKEKGIPRDQIFISTKPADIHTPLPVIEDIEKSLDNSLMLLGTDYIDLFCGVHACPKSDRLTDELGAFGEAQKKKGKIRFFGFSNHAGMVDNLTKAATLPWVDALLVQYSYRLANNPKLSEAIDACVAAKIGLISIKTQGFGAKTMSEPEKAITDVFTSQGYDEAQAKIKFVMEDKRFTSASIGMKTPEIVDSCASVALNKAALTPDAKTALETHARETCSTYCAGCPNICGAALPAGLPMMSDVMRYLMYSHSYYGEHDRARELFHKLPQTAKEGMLAADYSHAESLCPQRIPIAGMVAEAFHRFA